MYCPKNWYIYSLFINVIFIALYRCKNNLLVLVTWAKIMKLTQEAMVLNGLHQAKAKRNCIVNSCCSFYLYTYAYLFFLSCLSSCTDIPLFAIMNTLCFFRLLLFSTFMSFLSLSSLSYFYISQLLISPFFLH